MILASTTKKNGRKLLVLGLEEENIRRLKNDEPIYHNLQEQGIPGLDNWDVSILGPEDTVRFIASHGIKI